MDDCSFVHDGLKKRSKHSNSSSGDHEYPRKMPQWLTDWPTVKTGGRLHAAASCLLQTSLSSLSRSERKLNEVITNWVMMFISQVTEFSACKRSQWETQPVSAYIRYILNRIRPEFTDGSSQLCGGEAEGQTDWTSDCRYGELNTMRYSRMSTKVLVASLNDSVWPLSVKAARCSDCFNIGVNGACFQTVFPRGHQRVSLVLYTRPVTDWKIEKKRELKPSFLSFLCIAGQSQHEVGEKFR